MPELVPPAEVADPTVLRLQSLETEFVTHKARLAERAKELGAKVTAGALAEGELGGLIVELFQELHDTSLSFQQDLTRILREDLEAAPPDEEADVVYESQLEPADAAQLRRTTADYIAMVTAMLAPDSGYPVSARPALEEKLKDAEASADLIDHLELTDDDDEEADDEDDEGEDDSDPAGDEATN